MKLYGVVGAGGLGRQVMPLARMSISDSETELVFVVENDYPIAQKVINGHRVLSTTEFFSTKASERYFSIAIGDPKARERIAKSIAADVARPFSILAPNHVSFDAVTVEEGAILCPFTNISSNAKIGRFFFGNSYSSIGHDSVIGDFVNFGIGAIACGHVVVEDLAQIGPGAVIRDGSKKPIVIGRGAIVGMGAVVTKSVPPGVTVVGNPARLHNRKK